MRCMSMRHSKTLCSLLGTMICMTVLASPTRSSVAARQSAAVSKGEDVSIPYVTDGLVAMYDGIWNIGLDSHDSLSHEWVDLIGGRNLTIYPQYASWGDSHLVLSRAIVNNSDQYGALGDSPLELVRTIEIIGVFPTTIRASGSFFNCGYMNRGLGGFGGGWLTTNCYYGGANCRFFGGDFGWSSLREIAFVYNSDENIQDVTMYRNGEVYTGTSTIYGSPNNAIDGIGLRSNGTAMVYCIRCYSRTLAAEEIAYNFEIDKERFNLP